MKFKKLVKRIFDIIFSIIGLIVLFPILFIVWILACIDTQSNGFFLQKRIGQFGEYFTIYKLRTIHPIENKVSKIGNFLRHLKLDEFPQLLNVLQGSMSIVGPRPDITGYYDKLHGEKRLILQLKPGLTSTAAIKYSSEEEILSLHENPLKYNDEVIFPDKVKMNLAYFYNHTFFGDLKIILKTVWMMLK